MSTGYYGSIAGEEADRGAEAESALATVENMLARARPGKKSGPVVCATREEYEALKVLVTSLKAGGSTGEKGGGPCCEFHGPDCERPFRHLCCLECPC